MDIIPHAKEKMKQALEHLKTELKSIRTGRASPAILDGVVVEAYGSQMKLKELAGVTTPEPRQLLISPFDRTMLPFISKGIEKANLNLTPRIDGNTIRITIPPMDESTRKEMVKITKKKAEECKVAVRQVRRDCNEKVKSLKNAGEIPEDAMKKQEKKIQDLTDETCAEVDKIISEKEKEILAI